MNRFSRLVRLVGRLEVRHGAYRPGTDDLRDRPHERKLAHLLGRDALNSYAHGLTEHPGLLWSARAGLLAIFLIHMLFALRTWQDNQTARPIGYVHETPSRPAGPRGT